MQHYKQIDLIGQGSYGAVHLVKSKDKRLFALKTIKLDSSEVNHTLDVIKSLNHPNIVKVYSSQFDTDKQQLKVVMEYFQNGNLLNYFKMKNKQLSTNQIINLLKQIVKVLLAANRRGVIHRDLKPQNILISSGEVIKIADFGCSRSFNSSQNQNSDILSLDKLYFSPQRFNKRKYSSKGDVWSLGCLIYFLYFGTHPFMNNRSFTTQSILTLIKKKTKDQEIQLNRNTDLTIAKIIKLTLVYDQKERASWQQLWLSRLFSQKVTKINRYVEYLRNLTIIANWIVKEFWKIRKQYKIGGGKDQIFAYFMIKFQYTNIEMAMSILKKSQQFSYLFNQSDWNNYSPAEEDLISIQKLLHQQKKYFLAFKQSIQQRQTFKYISQHESIRNSPFIDLDNSIKISYQVLLDVRDKLKEEDNTKNSSKIWIAMSRLINFEKWYSFEKQPRVQKLISERIVGFYQQLREQINIYEKFI